MLEVSRVSKRYRTQRGERVALDDVSLEVDDGQVVGVFGATGAGKTTLLRIAAGLLRPDEGFVAYAGERLDLMPEKERKRMRRREVACVWSPQPGEERLEVVEHVAMPLLVDGRDHRTAERRAREALLACEAEHLVGLEVYELSDGERQRVEIARALVAEPRLLLADGPCSSLALVDRDSIMALLCSLAREARVAVLITARDAKALLGADPILYLRDGRLISSAETPERGTLYRFPTAGSRRAAADA
jgi:putative ABC transport system ATP-binding protein